MHKRKLVTTGETEISHKTTKKLHGWSSGRRKCLQSADGINMDRQATGERNSSRSWVCMQQSLFFKVREQLAGIRCLSSLWCWFQGSNSSSQVWLEVPMSSSSTLSSCLCHEYLLYLSWRWGGHAGPLEHGGPRSLKYWMELSEQASTCSSK